MGTRGKAVFVPPAYYLLTFSSHVITTARQTKDIADIAKDTLSFTAPLIRVLPRIASVPAGIHSAQHRRHGLHLENQHPPPAFDRGLDMALFPKSKRSPG